MTFFFRDVWVVQFLEADLKTSIGRSLTFADVKKIRDLIARTPTVMTEDIRYVLEYDIGKGRGGLYLEVTREQYLKLKEDGPRRR